MRTSAPRTVDSRPWLTTCSRRVRCYGWCMRTAFAHSILSVLVEPFHELDRSRPVWRWFAVQVFRRDVLPSTFLSPAIHPFGLVTSRKTRRISRSQIQYITLNRDLSYHPRCCRRLLCLIVHGGSCIPICDGIATDWVRFSGLADLVAKLTCCKVRTVLRTRARREKNPNV